MTDLEKAIAEVRRGTETFGQATIVLRAVVSGELIPRADAVKIKPPLVWMESHGGFYTDTHAVTERPEGGWVVSVRPIESPVFATAYEAKMFVALGGVE